MIIKQAVASDLQPESTASYSDTACVVLNRSSTMNLRVAFALWMLALLAVPLHATAAEGESEFFGLARLHTLDVEVAADDYTRMDPPPRPPFGGPPAGGQRQPPLPPEARGAGNFGFEFTYVPATVRLDGIEVANVGLRYKGSGTYMMSQRHVKRSLKIDFDRFDETQTFSGIKKLNFNSGVMDPTKIREALAYWAFREAGVAAPQTAFAEIALTVPGKFDGEQLGPFTIVEQVDKAFLKKHFGSGKGLLLKPEGIRGLPHVGTNLDDYRAVYGPKEEGTAAEWQRLVELTRLINVASEEEFATRIADYLDLESFARFVAVNTALASMDSFIGLGHNYYLYLSPETGKFVFIPWDLDLAFGAFNMFGSPPQLADLSIDHPYVGEHKLIERLMALPDWKSLYREALAKIVAEQLSDEGLLQQIGVLDETLEELLSRDRQEAERRNERSTGNMFGASPLTPADFIKARRQSLEAQLAGKVKGYVPTQGFGPGGFGGPPGGPPVGPRLFARLDTDRDGQLSEQEIVDGMRKLAGDWDTDGDGQLNQRELNEGLQRVGPRP